MRKFGMIVVISMIISGLVFTNVAFAGRAGKRQVHQQKRICQGVKSGELTGRETRRIEKEQRHIEKSKRSACRDGKFTPKERRRLEQKQNKASKHIYKMKHNDISR